MFYETVWHYNYLRNTNGKQVSRDQVAVVFMVAILMRMFGDWLAASDTSGELIIP
jgi:hypothetical protein